MLSDAYDAGNHLTWFREIIVQCDTCHGQVGWADTTLADEPSWVDCEDCGGQGEVTRASIYCRLVDLTKREYSQFDSMQEARKILVDYPDLRAAVQDVAAISASGFRQAGELETLLF